jgi:hypothetical protein
VANYEIPSGPVNGVNTDFSALAPVVSEQIFVDRILQIPSVDYTIVGSSTIRFASTAIPQTGSSLYLYYPGAGSAVPSGWATTTLASVRAAAQQRADMVNSQFLTTAEWTANINASYQELYGLLVQKFGADYYQAGTPDNWFQFTTTTAASYPLPDGTASYLLSDGSTVAPALFKVNGVDLQINSQPNGWLTLKSFMWAERNRFAFPNTQNFWGHSNIRYRINGNRIWLVPLPSAGQAIRIWYTPRLRVLVSDSDTLDGVNGWDEFIVIDAAIKALQKEESDVSILMAQKAAIISRLEAEAENRDVGMPAHVADVRRGDVYGNSWATGEGWGS